MRDDPVYLRSDVVFEPLLNGWYAWGHLVSPATFAMVTANLHVRVLDSFLRQPDLHRAAVREQSMRGGMFMDHDGPLEPVQALLASTRRDLGVQLSFAEAIKRLDALLAEQTSALSLSDLYARVPGPLRGLVELTYDLQGRASYRLIEPFLYATPLYDERLQSIRLSLPGAGERPFVLSSPRLPDERSVHLPIPFRSAAVDALSRLRFEPAPLASVHDWVGYDAMDSGERAVVDAMLTRDPPARPAARVPDDEGVRIRYFGHATVLMQTRDTAVLVDPAVAYPGSNDGACFSYADIPDRIDKVIVTHNHQDHVMLETLLQLRHRIGQVVVPRCASGRLQDPSLKLMLQAIGFEDVVELDELETVRLADGEIVGLPFLGEHADLDIRSKLAYAVTLRGRTAMFLADSNALEPRIYEHVHRRVGAVDALFVGLECDGAPLSWLYGPLFTRPIPRSVDQSRRLNSSDSDGVMAIVDRIDPAALYIYAMGLEAWLCYISSIDYSEEAKPIVESNRVLAMCETRGLPAERLFMKSEWTLPPRAPDAPDQHARVDVPALA